ncbi:hypothetical protein [Peribacillus sp. AS_2]|nr:hypothetical protein [Peribacillus sp. AS_2]MCZ0871236.1 hypothetical protein [Peribacillus sp. AS_2]
MSDDKQQILAVYERINDAMVNKDTETLNTIFEDNHKSFPYRIFWNIHP